MQLHYLWKNLYVCMDKSNECSLNFYQLASHLIAKLNIINQSLQKQTEMTLKQIIYNALMSKDIAVIEQHTEMYLQYTQQPQFFPNIVQLILNDDQMFQQYCILASKYLQKLIQNNNVNVLKSIANQNVLAQLLQKLISIPDEQTGKQLCRTIGLYQVAIVVGNEQAQLDDLYSCIKEFTNNVIQQESQLYYIQLAHIWYYIVEQNQQLDETVTQMVIQMMCFLLDKLDCKYYYIIYDTISNIAVTIIFILQETSEDTQNALKTAVGKLLQHFIYILDLNLDLRIILKLFNSLIQQLTIGNPDTFISLQDFQNIMQKLMSVQNIDYNMMAVQFIEVKLQLLYAQEYDQNSVELNQIYQLIQGYVIPLFGNQITQEYINSILASTTPEYIENSNCSFSNIVYTFMNMTRVNSNVVIQAFNGFMMQNNNVFTDNVKLSVLFTLNALVSEQLVNPQQILMIQNQFNITNNQNPIILIKLYQIYHSILLLYPRNEELIQFENTLMEEITPRALSSQITNSILILKLFVIEIINCIISNEQAEFISKYNQYLTQLITQYITDSNLQLKAKIIQLIKIIIQNQPQYVSFISIIQEHVVEVVRLLRRVRQIKYQLNLDEKVYLESMIQLLREIIQNKLYINTLIEQNIINVYELLQIIFDIIKMDDSSFDDSIINDILQLAYNSLYYCKNELPNMIQDIFQLISIMINKTQFQENKSLLSDNIQQISQYKIEIRKNVLQILKTLISILQNNIIPYISTITDTLNILSTSYIDRGLANQITSQLLYISVENNQVQHAQSLYQYFFTSPTQVFISYSFKNHIQSLITIIKSLIKSVEKQLFPQEQIEQWMKKIYNIIIQYTDNMLQFINPQYQSAENYMDIVQELDQYLDVIGTLFEFLASNQLVSQTLQGIQEFINGKQPNMATQLLQQQIYYSILQANIRQNKQTKIDINNTFLMLLAQSMSGYQINTITLKLLTLLVTHYKDTCLPIIINNIQPLQQQCVEIISQNTNIRLENAQFWHYVHFVLCYCTQLYPNNSDLFLMLVQCINSKLTFIQQIQYEMFILLQQFIAIQLQAQQKNAPEIINSVIILLVNLFYLNDVNEQIEDQQRQWMLTLINSNKQIIQDKQDLLLLSTKDKLQQLQQ